MKTYKIQTKIGNKTAFLPEGMEVEVTLNEQEVKDLIEQYNKPTHKRKYFVPRDGETFYYIDNAFCDVRESKYEQHREFSKFCVESGNSFRTMEDGYDELNRRQSLVKIWNNYDDKYHWDIDWEDTTEKYDICIYKGKLVEKDVTTYKQYTTELPYFKSAEDRNQFVEANRDDLLIIFNIKK